MSFLAAIPSLLGAGAGAAGAGGIGGALQVASLGAGLIGSFAQAAGQKREAEAAAQSAEFNARSQELQAQSERDAAQTEASDYRRRQGRIVAERRASMGASGLQTAGSPLLAEESMIREIALGSSRAGHQGLVRGTALEDEAALGRQNARNTRQAGRMAAGTTLLSGFGNFASGFGKAYL